MQVLFIFYYLVSNTCILMMDSGKEISIPKAATSNLLVS